jgi:N-carbamoyl-L-amino-acid hydrolase
VFARAFTLEHASRNAIATASPCAMRSQRSAMGDVRDAHPVGAYFEAHIEQGPVLEAHATTIGVVGALGQRWYDVTVHGMEAHAGPTPMALRRDALLVAADLVRGERHRARPPAARARHGRLDRRASEFAQRDSGPRDVDGRSARGRRCDARGDGRGSARGVCRSRGDGRHADRRRAGRVLRAQPFDAALVEQVRAGANALGLSSMNVISGAGHDAVYLARVAPAAMIFVPCKDGISHNEIEDAAPADLEAGCNVLLHAMLAAAGLAEGCAR